MEQELHTLFRAIGLTEDCIGLCFMNDNESSYKSKNIIPKSCLIEIDNLSALNAFHDAIFQVARELAEDSDVSEYMEVVKFANEEFLEILSRKTFDASLFFRFGDGTIAVKVDEDILGFFNVSDRINTIKYFESIGCLVLILMNAKIN